MALPRKELEKDLTAIMRADSSLEDYPIHNHEAPPDAKPPLILFQKVSGRPDDTFDQRGWVYTYQIKVISQARWPEEAMDIDEMIDSAVENLETNNSLSLTGFTVYNVRRIQDILVSEPLSSGIVFQHVGGIYEIMIYPS